MDDYEHKYPEAIKTLEEGLEDSLQFFNFEQIDSRKIASTNMIERLNREIRRRTKVVGIFPSIDSYIRLVTSYLIEYSEDWSTGWCYIDSKVITLIYEEKLKAALLIMRISLIIPAYNEELLIEKMLISVMKAKKEFEKTKKNQLEIIIVDNNSQDKTVEISKKYDVIVVPEEVHNIARVRNTGARYATGDILCFLDADSEVSTNMFNLVSKYMQTDKYVGGGTKFKLDRRNLTFSLIFVASVLATHIIGLSGVLIYMKKDFFDEIGAFNEQFYAAEDIDFVLRLRELGKQKGLKYCNIYRGYVVTSSRKFKVLEFKDLFMQGGLLLHKSLRESPAKCEQWYNDHDYR